MQENVLFCADFSDRAQTSDRSLEMHILIVEDEELDVIAIQRAFRKRRFRHEHSVARNGAEALSMLRDPGFGVGRRPILIVLDINMPRMNGIEFLTELRHDSQLRRIPVIVLTTSDENRDIEAAYNLGISGYTLKQNVGENFEKLLDLLDAYANVVLFSKDGP